DLVIGEIFPFETYHIAELSPDLTKAGDDYHDYMNDHVFNNITENIKNLEEGSRLVLVVPLRESKKHPTVEPLILYTLGKVPKLTFAGNLISHKKDFIVLLYIMEKREESSLEPWKLLYERIYPELNFKEEKLLIIEEKNDVITEILAPFKCEGVKQQPRETIIFPSKFRECAASTTTLSDGGMMYHFSAINKAEEEDVSSKFDQGLGNRVRYSVKEKKEKKEKKREQPSASANTPSDTMLVVTSPVEEPSGFENDKEEVRIAVITQVDKGEVITKDCDCHNNDTSQQVAILQPVQQEGKDMKEESITSEETDGNSTDDFEDLANDEIETKVAQEKKSSQSLFASIFKLTSS